MLAVISNLRGIAERINLLKETIYDRVTFVSYHQRATSEQGLTLNRVIKAPVSILNGKTTCLQ